jgi:hypothetical protein
VLTLSHPKNELGSSSSFDGAARRSLYIAHDATGSRRQFAWANGCRFHRGWRAVELSGHGGTVTLSRGPAATASVRAVCSAQYPPWETLDTNSGVLHTVPGNIARDSSHRGLYWVASVGAEALSRLPGACNKRMEAGNTTQVHGHEGPIFACAHCTAHGTMAGRHAHTSQPKGQAS